MTIFGLLVTRCAAGPDAEELVRLINAYRGAPQICEGRRSEPLAPLSPQAALFDTRVLSASRLMEALRAAGHPARHASVITVSGTADPDAALAELKRHYCAALLSAEASEVGVSREDLTWRIAVVQPLLGSDLPDWRHAGRELLDRVNAARAQARRCGDRRFAAVPALKWNERLAQAALAHSRDMARRNYFDHRTPEGSQAGERALRSGYRWRSIGENIAAGQGNARDVVAGWLVSPGHCANIMSPAFNDAGAAYAIGSGSEMTIYWTQVFGAPQP